jgi:hypothetical protein
MYELVCFLAWLLFPEPNCGLFWCNSRRRLFVLSPLTNYISKAKQVVCDRLHSTMLSQRMSSRGKYPITKPAFLTHFVGVRLRLGTVSQTASKRLLYPAHFTAADQYAKYASVCFVQSKFFLLSSSQVNPASIDPSQPNR